MPRPPAIPSDRIPHVVIAYLFNNGEFQGIANIEVQDWLDSDPKTMVRSALHAQGLNALNYSDVFVPRHPHYLSHPIHLRKGQ